MKKYLGYTLLLIVCFPLCSEADENLYFIGRIHLAGMVPETVPLPGSVLNTENLNQALKDNDGKPVGYIPMKYREALREMKSVSLPIFFEVEHVYTMPLPGKYVSVSVWTQTSDPSKIKPLIYSVPMAEGINLISMYE